MANKQHEAKEQIYQTTLDETHAKLPQTTMNDDELNTRYITQRYTMTQRKRTQNFTTISTLAQEQ